MNLNDPIIEIATGDTGHVCRIDEVTGFVFVLLDKYKGVPYYDELECGPFSRKELKLIGG